MRVVFVLRSAEIFPWFLRFVLPFLALTIIAPPLLASAGDGGAFFFVYFLNKSRQVFRTLD